MNSNVARQVLVCCNEARIRYKGNVCIDYFKVKENISFFRDYYILSKESKNIIFYYKDILLIEVIE